jgi:anti-anti-sigma factor
MSVSAIRGELTLATVPALLEQGGAGGLLDLAACPRMDSAGVAYLLERTRRARSKGESLQIVNANEQVRKLLHFFELDTILKLD